MSSSHAEALEQSLTKLKGRKVRVDGTSQNGPATRPQERREATMEETRGAIREELQQRPQPSRPPLIHDGYGFRPSSGGSTPSAPSSIPDIHGLGWPGG